MEKVELQLQLLTLVKKILVAASARDNLGFGWKK